MDGKSKVRASWGHTSVTELHWEASCQIGPAVAADGWWILLSVVFHCRLYWLQLEIYLNLTGWQIMIWWFGRSNANSRGNQIKATQNVRCLFLFSYKIWMLYLKCQIKSSQIYSCSRNNMRAVPTKTTCNMNVIWQVLSIWHCDTLKCEHIRVLQKCATFCGIKISQYLWENRLLTFIFLSSSRLLPSWRH